MLSQGRCGYANRGGSEYIQLCDASHDAAAPTFLPGLSTSDLLIGPNLVSQLAAAFSFSRNTETLAHSVASFHSSAFAASYLREFNCW